MDKSQAASFLDEPSEGVGGPMSKEAATSFLDEKPEAAGPASSALVSRIAGPLGRKAAASAADVARQLDPDVDYSGVPDAGKRTQYGFLDTPEEKQAFLEREYGKENITKDSFGRDVVIQGGKKVAFLPRAGRDVGKPGALAPSYADFAADVLPVSGMVAGGVAGGGPIAGPAMAGVGAMGGKAVNKLIKQWLIDANKQGPGETLADIGIEGVKGATAEAGGRVLGFAGRSMLRPFAPGSVFGPWTEAGSKRWAEQQADVDLARSYGLKPKIGTVSPAAGLTQRVQNAGFRLFGDDLVFKNRRILEAEAEKLTGGKVGALAPADVEKLNRSISGAVESQITMVEAQAKSAVEAAERELVGAERAITRKVGAPPPDLAKAVSDRIEDAKDAFTERVSQMYGPVDALMGKPVIPTAGVKSLMRQIVSEGPQTVGGKSVLASETIEKFAGRVLDMEDMATFQQMQMLRTVLANRSSLDKLNAGLSEGQAKRLWLSVDKAFNDAVDTSVSYPRLTAEQKAVAAPDGIVSAVAKMGGLRKSDVGGEFPDVTRVPSWARKGKNYAFWLQHEGPNARSLDDMRERLTEAGYLSEGEGIRDMVAKIEEELRAGSPKYFAAGDVELAAEKAAVAREQQGIVETVDSQAALRALRRADKLYAAGMKRFGDLSIEALYKDASTRGGVSADRVAQYIAQPGMADKFNRIAKVLGPDTMSQVASARWQQIVETSVNPMTGAVSGKRLAKQLNDMGPILDRLYGPAEATKMRVYARQLGAMSGDVTLAELAPGRVSEAIKEAITRQEIADETTKRLWMRQLREQGPESLQAANWLTHPENRLTLMQAIRVFGPDSAETKGLKEYLARKIFSTMEVPAERGAQRYGSTEIMGEPLVRELNRYGRTYLEDVFGKTWTEEAFKFARAAEVATRKNPVDSGGLIAASIGLHWIRHLGEIARFLTVGELLQSEAAITYWSRGVQSQGVDFLGKILMGGTRAGLAIGAEEIPKSIADRARGYRMHMQGVIDRRFRTPQRVEPRADGGPVVPGGRYLVGERGPEEIQVTVPGLVIPSGDVMGAQAHKAYQEAIGAPVAPVDAPVAETRPDQGVIPIPAKAEQLARLLVATGRAPNILIARKMALSMTAGRQ